MKKILLITILISLTKNTILANPDEGMWIPLLIEKYNITLMKEKGFRLSAEDIYSINRASMKDGVMSFGGGCTAEFISADGLVITNHHCGYGRIQDHSTLDHDYLTNGFWAMSKKEELPNPGLRVTLLKWMTDVTDSVLTGTNDEMSNDEREKIIKSNIDKIEARAIAGTGYEATIKPFFMGNQYFLFVNEVFRDVRLVGAPPSSIGRFGGDTDNWVWPRHTGDFSLFRVYADKNNRPAEYSPDNIPFKPAYFFPVSLKGVKEGDFTMVIGYPGTTSEYVSSYHIDMIKNYINPRLIDVRTEKINIINKAMESDPLIRIKYSAKKASISNSWKKWMGEIQGLDRIKTIENKKEFEDQISKWIKSDNTRNVKYGRIIPTYEKIYPELREYMLVNNITSEIVNGIEVLSIAKSLKVLADLVEKKGNHEEIKNIKKRIMTTSASFFKDYDQSTDRELFKALMKMYGEIIGEKWQAPEYIKMKGACKGDFSSLAAKLYSRSVFTDESRFRKFVGDFNYSSMKRLNKDKFYILSNDISNFIANNIRPELNRLTSEIQNLNRIYMKAQMEFNEARTFYPDANSTLRVAYGKVTGYFSRDAVYFMPVTTLAGVIEKDNPLIYDYDVPDKLKELYISKNYGRFGQNGQLNVCFIADNHTTGGNSGSPVLNSDGHLIGINFDRGWEGVASDMAYNPDQSRNISLDIRFALFIIDKFAGAGYLLDEMTIIE